MKNSIKIHGETVNISSITINEDRDEGKVLFDLNNFPFKMTHFECASEVSEDSLKRVIEEEVTSLIENRDSYPEDESLVDSLGNHCVDSVISDSEGYHTQFEYVGEYE